MRWPLVDRNGRYDFSSVAPFVAASKRHHVEVIWDLFHYGYPSDVDLFSTEFPSRFAEYCQAAARYVCEHTDGPCYFTPINEPSFFAWAAGEVGKFAPHCRGRGPELKLALAKAAICGINAIKSVAPHARIVNVDPLCRVACPEGRPDLVESVDAFNRRAVYESWDMICGRLCPELGGSREHLDLVGINYYWTNQWEMGRDECPLDHDDHRRVPLSKLIEEVSRRYGGELLITETSHVDDMRPTWLAYVAEESKKVLNRGVALRGVCLYPILGMPEWHSRKTWTLMGLWDLARREDMLHREVCSPMLEALKIAQQL
jgi:hypothetical protein